MLLWLLRSARDGVAYMNSVAALQSNSPGSPGGTSASLSSTMRAYLEHVHYLFEVI
jgi:hypothetical protein